MPISAIITADIVNSTLLTTKQEKKLMNALVLILNPYKYEFYRGDSFQIYIKDAQEALKLVLQIRLVAKKLNLESFSASQYDIRASIGIGAVNTPIRSLKTATGEAFVLSGRAFDEMRNSETRLVVQSPHITINIGLRVIALFIDYIFQQLTAKQSMVVSELLSGSTQIEVAKKLKKSQATINKHTQSSGWPQIVELLQEYQQLINQL